jgi:hypothetical protein
MIGLFFGREFGNAPSPAHLGSESDLGNEGAAFRTRLSDRCAAAGGTMATAASAGMGPTTLFSTANVTNANLIALSDQ